MPGTAQEDLAMVEAGTRTGSQLGRNIHQDDHYAEEAADTHIAAVVAVGQHW